MGREGRYGREMLAIVGLRLSQNSEKNSMNGQWRRPKRRIKMESGTVRFQSCLSSTFLLTKTNWDFLTEMPRV